MTLPLGVTLEKQGALQLITQRGSWAPPFTSCMFACVAMQSVWAGYRVDTTRKGDGWQKNFVYQLHKASGASFAHGSSNRHTKNALNALLPDLPYFFGRFTDAELKAELGKSAMLRVIVKCPLLPRHLRRFVGSYQGKHAICLVGYRSDSNETFVLDPMGRPWKGYVGEWTDFTDLLPAIPHSEGKTIASLTYRDDAVAAPSPEDIIVMLNAEIDSLTRRLGAALSQKQELAESNDRLIQAIGEYLAALDPSVARLLARYNEEKP